VFWRHNNPNPVPGPGQLFCQRSLSGTTATAGERRPAARERWIRTARNRREPIRFEGRDDGGGRGYGGRHGLYGHRCREHGVTSLMQTKSVGDLTDRVTRAQAESSQLQLPLRQLSPRFNVKLQEGFVQVVFDRAGADEEESSDLSIGLALCGAAGDL
jgi:hypothetical protein